MARETALTLVKVQFGSTSAFLTRTMLPSIRYRRRLGAHEAVKAASATTPANVIIRVGGLVCSETMYSVVPQTADTMRNGMHTQKYSMKDGVGRREIAPIASAISKARSGTPAGLRDAKMVMRETIAGNWRPLLRNRMSETISSFCLQSPIKPASERIA